MSRDSCKDCSSECLTCENIYTHCLTCKDTNLYINNGACVTTCPDHFFNDVKDSVKVCTACDVSCKTCTSALNSACTSCADGYYMSNSMCLKCDSNCLTCLTTSTNC